jgi:hypothetical protein
LERKRRILGEQKAILEAELDDNERELEAAAAQERQTEATESQHREEMLLRRGADAGN